MSSTESSPDPFVQGYLAKIRSALEALPTPPVGELLTLLRAARESGSTVFVAGNGGSAATASHMACDLMLSPLKAGKRALRTVALSDNVPIITALANDRDYDEVFAGQLEQLGSQGDVLIVISASGNSPNVLQALSVARRLGMKTVGLTGMGGGAVATAVDVSIVVPSSEYGPVEDVHLILNHLMAAYLSDA